MHSSLDGPKWAASGDRRIQSREPSVPVKPKPRVPNPRQQASLGSSARRLFPAPVSSSAPDDTIVVRPTFYAESDSGGASSDWLSTSSEVDDDNNPTPRASPRLDHSFFSDFAPQAPVASLVNDVRTVVNVVAQTGASLAGALLLPFVACCMSCAGLCIVVSHGS